MTKALIQWNGFLRTSVLVAFAVPGMVLGQGGAGQAVGLFRGSTEVGVTQPGTTTFDTQTKGYRMSGGGDDIWGRADSFRYTWVRMTGDGTVTADVDFVQPLSYPISKAVLMVRQSLAPGSAYADVAIHGDGHITLQYRQIDGGETKDTTLPEHGPTRMRIERRGDRYTAYAVLPDGHLGVPSSITVPMTDPVYVGIGVGSHNVNQLQTVTFRNLQVEGFSQR